MLGTNYNKHFGLILGLLFFLFCHVNAQEKQPTSVGLIPYLKTLENRFDVKFSYIDKDLEGLNITMP